MERIGAERYRLSTGRVLVALGGVLGIEPGEPALYGHGGGDLTQQLNDHEGPLSSAERQELGAYMGARWIEWAVTNAPPGMPLKSIRLVGRVESLPLDELSDVDLSAQLIAAKDAALDFDQAPEMIQLAAIVDEVARRLRVRSPE